MKPSAFDYLVRIRRWAFPQTKDDYQSLPSPSTATHEKAQAKAHGLQWHNHIFHVVVSLLCIILGFLLGSSNETLEDCGRRLSAWCEYTPKTPCKASPQIDTESQLRLWTPSNIVR